MKIVNLQQNSDEWFDIRKGKITGSKLKDVITKRGNGVKAGVYKLIADRIAVDADDEDVRDRGHRLEEMAAEAFEKEYKLKLDQDGMWISEDNENMAVSPDRVVIDDDGVRRVAVEIKCLNSASHIQYAIEPGIPNEFKEQVLQYFIVNPDLNVHYLAFYDDRIPSKSFHVKTTERADVQDEVDSYLEQQQEILKFVDEWVEKLAF